MYKSSFIYEPSMATCSVIPRAQKDPAPFTVPATRGKQPPFLLCFPKSCLYLTFPYSIL